MELNGGIAMRKSDIIYLVEKNHRGAWVIYGINGVMQYYDYTKKQAMEMYIQEAESKIFTRRK